MGTREFHTVLADVDGSSAADYSRCTAMHITKSSITNMIHTLVVR